MGQFLCEKALAPTVNFELAPSNHCRRNGEIYKCYTVLSGANDCLTTTIALCGQGYDLCNEKCEGSRLSTNRPNIDEAISKNKCEQEKYVDRAIELLKSAFHNGNITDHVLASYQKYGRNKYTRRNTIINDKVFLSNLSDVPAKGRAWDVVKQLIRLIESVRLPDTDFVMHVGDGVPEHAWSLTTPDGEVKVPVFVQDAWESARVILAPARSVVDEGLTSSVRDAAAAAAAVPFLERHNKAVWRGSTTGALYTEANWREQPRSKAVLLSRRRPDLLDAGFTNLNAQADSATTVAAMRAAGVESAPLSHAAQFGYQMILVLDGNTVADRLPAQLAGDSVIVKQRSDRLEFWYHRLRPGETHLEVPHTNERILTHVDAQNILPQCLSGEGHCPHLCQPHTRQNPPPSAAAAAAAPTVANPTHTEAPA